MGTERRTSSPYRHGADGFFGKSKRCSILTAETDRHREERKRNYVFSVSLRLGGSFSGVLHPSDD